MKYIETDGMDKSYECRYIKSSTSIYMCVCVSLSLFYILCDELYLILGHTP